MRDQTLENRVVLVTGATGPLGTAAALCCAAAGAWVAVSYRADLHQAKRLVDAIRAEGGRALAAPGTLATPEGAWRVARWIEDEWGQIDALVHAAPLAGRAESLGDVRPLLAELVPLMRARAWGRVVLCAAGDAAGERDLARAWSGPDVRVEALGVPDSADDAVAMFAARVVLVLTAP